MVDDATLQATVMEELDWEPSVDASHIGVTAKSGVVTLTGFVGSYAAKIAAERAAGRVHGVRAIAEHIEVRLPNAQKHADDEIAERALRILAWDIEVPEERIQVKVESGLVALKGEVEYNFQRDAAETAVRRLGGVRDVINMIGVRPTAESAIHQEIVQRSIQNALRRSAEIEASQTRVHVTGDRVTLRGTVRTRFELRVVENVAGLLLGLLKSETNSSSSP